MEQYFLVLKMQHTKMDDRRVNDASYAVFQIVKILYSKTMFRCFKKHCLILRGLFHDKAAFCVFRYH